MVEDEELLHRLLKRRLGEEATLISALTLKDARALFAEHAITIDVIIMDGRVPEQDGEGAPFSPNTIEFVRQIRGVFGGPMVATSGDHVTKEELVEAGCDYSCDKGYIYETLLNILGLCGKELDKG
jgi:DNA-binding response OmpR family regulator